MIGKIHIVFILLSLKQQLINVVYGGLMQLPAHKYNNTHEEAIITMSAKAKFNGTYLKTNSVPIKSRFTLYCKVWLHKNHENLFSLMLVSFTLPNGEQVVPGRCTVYMKHTQSCKRCKMVVKNVALSDQGKYRCHAQYFFGTDTIKKDNDIFIYVKKNWCPPHQMFCKFTKMCVVSLQQCKTQSLPQQNTHQLKVKSYSGNRNISSIQLTNSKGKVSVLLILVLSIIVTIFGILSILGAVGLWMRRKRQGFTNENKLDR